MRTPSTRTGSKTCSRCGGLIESAYERYGALCRACKVKRNAERHPTKICSKCGGVVDTVRIPYGRRCRDCRNKATREWVKNNPEKRLGETLRSRLANWGKQGIRFSHEEYDELLASQGGKCAVCRTANPGGRGGRAAFHVDHDHDYHHVRGLLCSRCNQALGLLRDSPHLLRAALRYLNAHRPQLKLIREG